jgi:Uma2 family endonuclease
MKYIGTLEEAMSAQPRVPISEAEYLAFERDSDQKHEYFDGQIYFMAGGTATHDKIAGNTYASLHGQLRNRSCSVYSSDLRIRVAQTGLYTYPDVSVVCGREQFADEREDTLMNPIVIIEVLSPSTEKYDRGKKFQHYRTILSLREYVLISQDDFHIERYTRQDDNQWLLAEVTGLDAQIELSSIQASLALRDVYAKVTLAAETTEDQAV